MDKPFDLKARLALSPMFNFIRQYQLVMPAKHPLAQRAMRLMPQNDSLGAWQLRIFIILQGIAIFSGISFSMDDNSNITSERLWVFLWLLGTAASFLLNHIIEIYALVVGIPRVRRLMTGDSWDLLWLSNAPLGKVLLLELEGIRAQLHRLTFFNVSLRIALAVAFVVGIFGTFVQGSPVDIIVSVVVAVVFAIVFVFDPLWHMCAASAVALKIATENRDNVILSSIANILWLWAVQFVLTWVIPIYLVFMFNFSAAFGIIVGVAAGVFGLYHFYRMSADASAKAAIANVSRRDPQRF
jgi:hypothetical protein